MPLIAITPPAAEPMDLAAAKLFLRVDHDAEDGLITELVQGARRAVEDHTRRALIDQTWQLKLDCFPWSNGIALPLPPLRSVTHIKYYDSDAVEQTLSAPLIYQVSTAGDQAGRIVLNDGEVWPEIELGKIEAVEIEFVAGYGAAATDVPVPLILAMKALIADWYENRLPADQRGIARLARSLFPYQVPV